MLHVFQSSKSTLDAKHQHLHVQEWKHLFVRGGVWITGVWVPVCAYHEVSWGCKRCVEVLWLTEDYLLVQ